MKTWVLHRVHIGLHLGRACSHRRPRVPVRLRTTNSVLTRATIVFMALLPNRCWFSRRCSDLDTRSARAGQAKAAPVLSRATAVAATRQRTRPATACSRSRRAITTVRPACPRGLGRPLRSRQGLTSLSCQVAAVQADPRRLRSPSKDSHAGCRCTHPPRQPASHRRAGRPAHPSQQRVAAAVADGSWAGWLAPAEWERCWRHCNFSDGHVLRDAMTWLVRRGRRILNSGWGRRALRVRTAGQVARAAVACWLVAPASRSRWAAGSLGDDRSPRC
jgi:hypothetical protein